MLYHSDIHTTALLVSRSFTIPQLSQVRILVDPSPDKAMSDTMGIHY